MPGRHPRVCGHPLERIEQERIEAASDVRPCPPDHALDDRDEQAGAATAVNRNPTRTMIVASTRCESGVSTGGSAASTRNRIPSGQRNQPDFPNSVISWNTDTTH